MRSIVWTQPALDDLTLIWLSANSEERFAITQSAEIVDRRLFARAATEGESRSHGLRIMFVAPLAVTYHFDSSLDQVNVARIRSRKRRKP
jgi:plasmid stabilization system protein ParE